MAISEDKHKELDLIKQEGRYLSLHCHSMYSYKDAISTPDEIAKRSLELGNDAFCITEHGNLASLIQGFKAQDKYKIQFIPGMEGYLIPESRYWDLNKKKRIEAGEEVEEFATRYHHITLIAKNQNGLQNLIKIYNRKDMHYGKECISRDLIFEYGDDIIVLSGCIAGEAIYYIKNEMDDKAKEILKLYKDRFGEDFYVEVQYHGLDMEGEMEELDIYNKLISMARELDIEMVPTTDSHYTYPKDADDHNLFKCMHYDGSNKDKFKYNFETESFASVFSGDGYYIMSDEEIKKQISPINSLSKDDIDHIVKNTITIRDKCEVCLFPEAMPLKDKSKELRKLVEKGFKEKRVGTKLEKESKERYEFELSVIEKLGFTEYFTNVKDIVNRAEQLNILVGPARGSAAGCEICYLSGIVAVDPLRYGLMFERFLNPSRFNYPDIDIDVQSDKNGILGKDIVIDSLGRDKFKFYGHVLNEMRASTVILFKSLARLFNISAFESNKVTTDEESKTKYLVEKEYTNWLPGHLEKLGIPFTTEWQEFEKYIDFCYTYGGGQSHNEEESGILWNTSIHASAVLFYPTDNKDVLPKSVDGVIYKGHDLEDMGYIKYDMLSVDGLNVINEFMKRIEEDTGKKFDWQDNEDEETWEVFKEADTDFVFQFSSPGMKRLLRNVKPNNISDLAELNALYRPGALGAGIVDRYVKGDYEPYELVVGNFLKKYFGEEHSNAMIFQEDIMKIVEKMAGFTLAEADMVRRAMQRKEPETLAKYKGQFLENFDKEKWAPDYDEEEDGPLAQQIWDAIEEFAAYTFNKSHSVAYGLIAYWTAYIFKHYKNDMLKYMLDSGKQKQEVVKYLSKDHKIVFPSLETKNKDYIVTDNELRLPTIIDYDPDETFAHYILNLDADKKKMIKKLGIFDHICIDRKGLVELGDAIPKKKKESLSEIELESLETDNIYNFIEALSVLDILDYEKDRGVINIKVHKPKSDKDIELKIKADEETLFFNAQEDVRAFGLPRDAYADQAPEINFDSVVTRVEDYYSNNVEDNPDLSKEWLLKKCIEAEPSINRIPTQEYDVILTDKKVGGGRFSTAEIAFTNDILNLGIKNKKSAELIKTLKKNSPITVKLKANFYINRDGDIDYRLNITDAWVREV